MEVDAISFPHHLLGILTAISEADFVSFDLELSGIPSRIPGRPRISGRATLEERYLEAKSGAERHQILQVGFTCARFDYTADKYVLRPYNVNISPLVEERLDIEREFTFQSGAVAFLLKNGFKMDAPFTQGVQYLSRDEAELVKQMAYDRIDKKNIYDDMQLKETDVDSLDFVRRVREAITNWNKASSSLIITTHTGLEVQPDVLEISRFEKRLVYQLLRAEFPQFVAIGRNDCMKIIVHDALREKDNSDFLKRRVREQILRQTGFRWIIEALARGRIDRIDPIYFAKNEAGMTIAADLHNIKTKFDRTAMRIKDRQPVLVGHNMFTDLVYLYRTFIGALPETLQEFCAAIHELFPRIVDTKYMATHDGGDLNVSPTLQAVAESLQSQELPDIVTHAAHQKYHNTKAYHEAGFDSLLTATIMLRLSTKLNVEAQASRGNIISDSRLNCAPESLDGSKSSGKTPGSIPNMDGFIDSEPLHDTGASKKSKKRKPRKSKAKDSVSGTTNGVVNGGVNNATSRFASQNAFAGLQISDEDSDKQPAGNRNETDESSRSSDGREGWVIQSFETDESKCYEIDVRKRDPMELLPDSNSDFWQKFGNKLRIFGTEETVLHIAEWTQPEVWKSMEWDAEGAEGS